MRFTYVISVLCAGFLGSFAAAQSTVTTGLLTVDVERPLPVSRLDLAPDNLGVAGAELAIKDNQTTGRFLKQDFVLDARKATAETALAELESLIADGVYFIGVSASTQQLIALSRAAGDRALLFNVTNPDDALRGTECQPNLLHMGPSRAMLADGLTQYLVWKKWTRLGLIEGSHQRDQDWGGALRNSAKKFGLKIRHELVYEDTGGARRTDTGHILVQRQMPVFTQSLKKIDTILVADESQVFGAYVPYHSWAANLVAGSFGLTPSSWHPGLEAWGATQFQRRFERANGRRIWPEDYQTWLAVRVVGEAASRVNSTDTAKMRDFILGPDFEMAGFKGQKMTIRDWNGQMRQPILLSNDRLIVSVSPQDGFLHPTSLLDTLGYDRAESSCQNFNRGSK